MQDFVQPTIKLGLIVPGDNYRETYDPQKLAELREQIIATGGVSSPIKVRPHPTEEGKWEIVFGKRRWLCARDLFGEDYDMPRHGERPHGRAGACGAHHRKQGSRRPQCDGGSQGSCRATADQQRRQGPDGTTVGLEARSN